MTDKEKRELHIQTINNHIKIVRDLCYQMGIADLKKKIKKPTKKTVIKKEEAVA